MNKEQRLRAAIAGELIDRVPVALWRHFPVDDQDAQSLAAATLEWQQQYDFDLIKVTPASSFCLKDWGADDAWRGNPEGTRDYTRRAVQDPRDWARLAPLDPTQGHLGQQLRALELIVAGRGDAPVIQTVFSPLSQARNLVGKEHLAYHLREHGAALQGALEVITATTVRFVEAARRTGIAGIFYAVQYASTDVFSEAEYRAFGEPYDRQVLAAAADLWLNLVHVHGEHVLFDLVAGYPAAMVNWHDTLTPPNLAQGLRRLPAGVAVCGGLTQWQTMVYGTPEQVRQEAFSAIAQTAGRRFVLGTGCVTPVIAPRANLRAARDFVET
jgi:uroporphyrinogen decarboxylase